MVDLSGATVRLAQSVLVFATLHRNAIHSMGISGTLSTATWREQRTPKHVTVRLPHASGNVIQEARTQGAHGILCVRLFIQRPLRADVSRGKSVHVHCPIFDRACSYGGREWQLCVSIGDESPARDCLRCKQGTDRYFVARTARCLSESTCR